METRHEPVLTRVPVAGHSLHRWLVGIPVILYVATVAFFGLYAYDHSLMWLRDGIVTNLVAVIAALIVAIPGLLDFLAIPTGNPARKVAMGHASLMVVVLSLFVANLVVNFRVLAAALKGVIAMHRGFDGTLPLVLTAVALGVAVCGGTLGLLLANRYHIGDTVTDNTRPPRTIQPRFR
jgi:uncharacterized membrane protein